MENTWMICLWIPALVSLCAAETVHHHHNYFGDVHNHYGVSQAERNQGNPLTSQVQRDGPHVEHHRASDNHDDPPHLEHHTATGRHDDPPHLEHHRDNDQCDGERTYTFQLSGDYAAYEYIGEDGFLHGFNPDFVKKVCEKAGKTCYWMYDTFEHCWTTSGGHQLPGQGLTDGWYDGCVGVYPTQRRRNSFNFTTPYSQPIRAILRFKADLPPTTNLKGLRIGFGEGWASNPECISKQTTFHGNKLGDFETRFYESYTAMLNALSSGEVHAISVAYGLDHHTAEELEHFSHPFRCTTEGCSIMTRYGSDVIDWWNKAVEDMMASGEYRQFCDHARSEHGKHGNILCLSPVG